MALPFVDEVEGLSKVIKKIIMLFFGVHRRAKFIDFFPPKIEEQSSVPRNGHTLINGRANTGV